ncbi:transposase [Arenibacter algicola]|uniref:Transposase n=1 Tax=Arenibacter algicola TaxID=616991 RepID=A0A221UV27_9FLAO|nr:transposase [Arenibacter algicola]
MVESLNDILKTKSFIEHTSRRSFSAFITNMFYGLIAYAIYPTKPSIN